MSVIPEHATQLAEQIRSAHHDLSFGIIKFWGMSVVPTNDQSYVLVSTHAEGDRLDLVFVHESRQGLPGVISLWQPEGLEAAPAALGKGLCIRGAARVRLDDNEATREGDTYRIRTARGEGTWPIEGEPALLLAR